MAQKEGYVWYARKRTLFGLPLSFTKYYLTDEKLLVQTGFFSTKEEEVRLYRIMDLTLNRSLGQKILRLGTIHLCCADKTTPEFEMKGLRDSRKIKDLLSDMVENERKRKRVYSRESLMETETDADADFPDHF